MSKYIHPDTRQLADDKKVVLHLDRIMRAFHAFHEAEKAWQCLTTEDTAELRELEQRVKVIKAKYTHQP